MRLTKAKCLATTAVATLALLAAGCGGGSGFDDPAGQASQSAGPAELKLLFASGGPADMSAVKGAADAWAAKSGNKITVTAATDMNQEMSQGFASGNPPDVFSVDSSVFAGYAKAGNLFAYGDKLPMKADFYPSLAQSFTYEDKFYCAPKDVSALALIINTDLWQKAGLSDSDIPKDWDQLAAVAKKLTSGKVKGLVIGDTRDRLGAFMKQSGGWITNEDQTQMTADTPENLEALKYVQKLMADKVAAYPKAVGAGWGGEAFGKGIAAMTIEGNWIKGAMQNDYKNVKYMVAELPKGPKAKATLAFTQCWGIAAKSKYQEQALNFIESLMTPETQLKMAKGFGVMPSLTTAKDAYAKEFPKDAAFLAGLEYAQGPVTAAGMKPVLDDFDTKLQGLPGADPKTILASLQKNGSSVLGG
ncbi:MAG: extracellular solute-binding protein [Propionibacteriaceae bacterium]|nr:extracellular solute-binding protein [Propionibacteriaceae bacterium]